MIFMRSTWLFVVLAVLIGGQSVATAGFRMRYHYMNGVRQLALEDVARFYGMEFKRVRERAYFSSRYSRLVFNLEKRKCEINGVVVHLCHAAGEAFGFPMVSELDFRRTLDPILRKWSMPRQSVGRVVIDPGHGGRDPGCHGKKLVEKDLTLVIARKAASLLRGHGFDVILTRSSDRYLSLSERTHATRRQGADVFISIHANATAADSVSGIETFVLNPKGAPSTYSNSVNETVRPGNAFDKENMRLAYEIQKHSLALAKADDRGVKRANFQVLRDASCPAVLIEVGFLTNRSEEFLLSGDGYRNKIASGIARGVIAYRQAVGSR